jgi:AraC-like DNA-binding protein
MVSIRCKMVVKAALDKIGLLYKSVSLGEADISKDISDTQRARLKTELLKSGLELMDDHKTVLIEKIKNVVVEMVHYSEEPINTNFSDYLSKKLRYDYTYLSNIFSEVMNITIEHYIISHKIERVKELLIYDELNLTQISYKLNYSSVAHLSNQFKKVTGFTPTQFRHQKRHRRNPLENM